MAEHRHVLKSALGGLLSHSAGSLRTASSRGALTLHLRRIPASMAMMGITMAGYAQAATAATAPVVGQTYHIAAGKLGTALSDFGVQSGVTVQLDSRLTEGLTTSGLDGQYTVQDGLAALLKGSRLQAVERGNDVYVIQPRSAGSTTAAAAAASDAAATDTADVTADNRPLAAVSVTASSHSGPYGVTNGYVAESTTSATKSSTSILETAQSVSVVTRDQMTQQDAQTLNAAVRYTSGVTAETRGATATRYDLLNVRGFSADTYWNGLKLVGNGEYSTPQLDPYLMDRIEVLKGPVSVLYGQASAGGVLDQDSKMPTATPLHEIGVEFGNYAHKQTTFDFSGPLDADRHWLYRFTAIARSEDGQVNTTKNERIAIAPAITWRPDSNTMLTLLASYQRDPRSTSYGSVVPQGTILFNPNGTLPQNFYDGDTGFERFSRTQESVGYKFEHKLDPDWTVRANGRYLHLGQDYASVYGSSLEADDRTLDRYAIESIDQMNTVTLDNQVEGKLATGPIQHTVLFGFDYQHMASGYRMGYAPAPSLDIFAPDYSQQITAPDLTTTEVRSNQYGLYAQDQMRYKNLILTLSGREDWASTDTHDVTDATDQRQSEHAFTKRAGLTYVFDSGFAPYVSYTESFSPQTGTDVNGKAFDPERARQYELGIKYAPNNYNALFTAAIFDLTRKNLLTTDASNPNFESEAGEARSRGVELEAKASLTDSLNVTASYTYLDTKYTKDNSGLQGLYLAAIPQNQASAWAYYTLHSGPFAGLSIGGGVRYTGQTYSTDNSFTVKSFVLADATLRYDLGHAVPKLKGSDLYINVQNLFNKSYIAACWYGDFCNFGYGRQVFAGMNYRW